MILYIFYYDVNISLYNDFSNNSSSKIILMCTGYSKDGTTYVNPGFKIR